MSGFVYLHKCMTPADSSNYKQPVNYTCNTAPSKKKRNIQLYGLSNEEDTMVTAVRLG
jgi:hypothetical protein